MDMPTTQPTAVSLSDLRTILAGLEGTEEQKDPRARQQAVVLAFGRRSSAQPPLAVLMQDAGTMLAEMLQADFHGIAQILGDGSELSLSVVPAGQEAGDPTPLVLRGRFDPANSAAAYAIHKAQPVATSDLPKETRFTDLLLRKLGVVSLLTLPLHLAGKPLGAIGVYARRARPFSPDDVRFMETIAHLLTPSVGRAKIEEELRQHCNYAATVFGMIDSLVIALDPEGNILDLNQACLRATGFSMGDVRGKPLASVLAVPGEANWIQERLREAKRPKPAGGDRASSDLVQFESQLATKRGPPRRVLWSLCAVRNPAGLIQSLVMTGTDRTELVEAELQLKCLREQVAGGAGPARPAPDRVAGLGRSPAPTQPQPGPQPDPADVLAGSLEGLRPFQLLGRKVARELRSSPRRAFKYYQMIAPMFGGVLPKRKKFFEVECEDISAGGIAFYMNRPPDFDTLVVALGRPPAESYLTARVVRVAKKERDGQRLYLVGCRFTGRVNL
ncbi:MAG: GAF domain-containing protein [Thermoguttaceae bacterium]